MNSPLHSWSVSPTEALSIQHDLKSRVKIQAFEQPVRLIAGADISYNRGSDTFYAGIVLLDYQTLQVVMHSLVVTKAPFPYVPGLLSFREIPALLKAWQQLDVLPDITMLDGHGIAHPRRLGIASHFGLWVEKPTIGCAKKLLTGMHESPPSEAPAKALLYDKKDTVGYALRSRSKVKPIYVSPGHLTDMDSAVRIALHCVTRYRIPEPTRQAHHLVNRFRRGEEEAGVKEYIS